MVRTYTGLANKGGAPTAAGRPLLGYPLPSSLLSKTSFLAWQTQQNKGAPSPTYPIAGHSMSWGGRRGGCLNSILWPKKKKGDSHTRRKFILTPNYATVNSKRGFSNCYVVI